MALGNTITVRSRGGVLCKYRVGIAVFLATPILKGFCTLKQLQTTKCPL